MSRRWEIQPNRLAKCGDFANRLWFYEVRLAKEGSNANRWFLEVGEESEFALLEVDSSENLTSVHIVIPSS